MTTIGVVADTHIRPGGKRQLPAKLFEVFEGVDLILHAGDLNTMRVVMDLEAIAPVLAVHGNNCDTEAMGLLPAARRIEIEGCVLGMVHGDEGRGGDTAAKALSHFDAVDCVIFGHSHWPLIQWKRVGDGSVLLFNPGSATDPRRSLHPSCGLLRVDGTRLEAQIVALAE